MLNKIFIHYTKSFEIDKALKYVQYVLEQFSLFLVPVNSEHQQKDGQMICLVLSEKSFHNEVSVSTELPGNCRAGCCLFVI